MSTRRDRKAPGAQIGASDDRTNSASSLSAALEQTLTSLTRQSSDPKLFPHGINRISLKVDLPGGIGGSLDIEGPALGAALNRAGGSENETEFRKPPPPPTPGRKDPKPAPQVVGLASDLADFQHLAVAKSIVGAANAYNGKCVGGDAYDNNCAHYLSDAFIRAGYSELSPPCDCITARCGTPARRPIRAREMWCWFKSMQTQQQVGLPKNAGLWAVFQLDEAQYWGGHVVIIDTDNNTYYGTGNYPGWIQYCYKW